MKIALVNKRTVFQKNSSNPEFVKLVNSAHPSISQIKTAHEDHLSTLENVIKILEEKGQTVELLRRSKLHQDLKFDLYITIGGDGTFLSTARYCLKQKILGVNSSPSTSVGFFCSTNKNNFEQKIDSIINHKSDLKIYERLKLSLNNDVYTYPVLNDLLIAHSCPASLSKYIIKLGNTEQEQRSSGIWVSTSAGSGAALHSAGGKKVHPLAKEFHYIVREPYTAGNKWNLLGGSFNAEEHLQVVSSMSKGKIFVDGDTKTPIHFPNGSVLKCSRSEYPLQSY